MENDEVIRLNIRIHPDKDPVLHKMLKKIASEARTRRFINLADKGLFAEINGLSHAITTMPAISISNDQEFEEPEQIELSTTQTEISSLDIDPEELESIGDIFGTSKN